MYFSTSTSFYPTVPLPRGPVFAPGKHEGVDLILLHQFRLNRLCRMRHCNQSFLRNKFSSNRTDSVSTILNSYQSILKISNVLLLTGCQLAEVFFLGCFGSVFKHFGISS